MSERTLTLSKNKKFLILNPPSHKDIPNAIKIWYSSSSVAEHALPIATTDIKKGRKRYYLPEHPDFKLLDFALVYED